MYCENELNEKHQAQTWINLYLIGRPLTELVYKIRKFELWNLEIWNFLKYEVSFIWKKIQKTFSWHEKLQAFENQLFFSKKCNLGSCKRTKEPDVRSTPKLYKDLGYHAMLLANLVSCRKAGFKS